MTSLQRKLLKCSQGQFCLYAMLCPEGQGAGCCAPTNVETKPTPLDIKTRILIVTYLYVWNSLPEAGVAELLENFKHFSSSCFFLSPCVCLALVPVSPSPYAHPSHLCCTAYKKTMCLFSEMHLLNSQHSEACCPICLQLSFSYFFMAYYLYQFLVCCYVSVHPL